MSRYTSEKQTNGSVPTRLQAALGALYEAAKYAEETACNYWEFAVEIEQLTSLGLTPNDFRWLVRSGLVQHQREVTLEGDNGREFRRTGDLTFPDRTCFVLTDKGISVASEICQSVNSRTAPLLSDSSRDENCGATRNRDAAVNEPTASRELSVPNWDADKRELRIDGTIIKRFRWTAANQEAILAAFQEEGWPARIDDPLPPQPEQDPKRRLSDTTKCLNRKQTNELVHFRGDGTGEGVIWERVELNGSSGSE